MSVSSSPIGSRTAKLLPLEFRVWQRLKALEISDRRVLVACSGGRDSVALVACLKSLATRLRLELAVASVHHGRSRDRQLRAAREQAFQSVKKNARAQSLSFYGCRRDGRLAELFSENDLRDYRHRALREIAHAHDCELIALGHHADDLFETRLIRLMRGTGPQGLVAMTELGRGLLRPFLHENRAEIARYAAAKRLAWHDDPSNRALAPLRNWLRHDWLASLETKRPGAKAAFARSLQNMAESLAELGERAPSVVSRTSSPKGDVLIRVSRDRYRCLARAERRRQIAHIFLTSGAKGFKTSHIDEVLKRIEVKRPTDFRILNLSWQINAEQILITGEKSPESPADLSFGE